MAVDSRQYLPIHCAALNGRIESIELLLKFDPNAASKKTNNEYQCLPLLLVVIIIQISSQSKFYTMHIQRLYLLGLTMKKPHLILQRGSNQQDMTAMTTLDDGWLPLHSALKDDVSLGSIKLLTKANRVGLR